MLPVTIAQFRIDFAEFADTSKYPDAMITFWMTVAVNQVQNASRWASLLPMAQELVTAHYVVLASRDRAAGANGGTPGTPQGLVSSESAADLSVTYEYAGVMVEAGGSWNLTSYGQRYYSLARLVGAGGMQLQSPC